VAGVAAPALDQSVLSLALGQLFFAVAGMTSWLLARKYTQRLKLKKMRQQQLHHPVSE
jgi:hypothetical protein